MKHQILLPTYNERENLKYIIPEIMATRDDVYVLVVDDSSPDGTADEVRSMMNDYPRLSIHVRKKKEGLGEAYKDAMRRVRNDSSIETVLTMDADGSHDAQYINQLVDLVHSGEYDFIIGSRYVQGGMVEEWEGWRKNLSKYGNLYARTCAGLGLKDMTSGFSCVSRELLSTVDLDSIGTSGYAFLMEYKFAVVHDAKARAKEIPIIFKKRREGESKLSHHIISEGIVAPLKLVKRRITTLV